MTFVSVSVYFAYKCKSTVTSCTRYGLTLWVLLLEFCWIHDVYKSLLTFSYICIHCSNVFNIVWGFFETFSDWITVNWISYHARYKYEWQDSWPCGEVLHFNVPWTINKRFYWKPIKKMKRKFRFQIETAAAIWYELHWNVALRPPLALP